LKATQKFSKYKLYLQTVEKVLVLCGNGCQGILEPYSINLQFGARYTKYSLLIRLDRALPVCLAWRARQTANLLNTAPGLSPTVQLGKQATWGQCNILHTTWGIDAYIKFMHADRFEPRCLERGRDKLSIEGGIINHHPRCYDSATRWAALGTNWRERATLQPAALSFVWVASRDHPEIISVLIYSWLHVITQNV